VACGKLLLDRALAREQPVHRRVQIVLARVDHGEVLGQRRGVPPARGGQLRMRRHDARSHHRQHQLALAAGLGGDHGSEPQALQRQSDRLRRTMRARTHDFEGLSQRHEGLAL
jgi:hypothetical protein